MPLRDGDLSSLVRVVEGLDGTVDLDMMLKLRFQSQVGLRLG